MTTITAPTEGLRRRRRHRPPRGAARRPDRPDASASAPSAATSASSAWPTRTSCCSPAPRPTRSSSAPRDEELDQAAAYPFMTPMFGEGVVFDASPEERRRALHNQSLRDKFMRGHAATITAEIERMVADWDDEGEIDLLDWFAELTIYTSSSCLIGEAFREELDVHVRRALPRPRAGTDAIAFVDPYADIESFRRRDAARAELVGDHRGDHATSARAEPARRRRGPRPGRRAACRSRTTTATAQFSADIVTGMFISMMFAGHHTTSGTASWTLIELLRNPERDGARSSPSSTSCYADGGEVTYQALREMPVARVVHQGDAAAAPAADPAAAHGRWSRSTSRASTSPAGKLVGASPSVSNRLPEAFADADALRPGALPRAPPGRRRQPVELDPVRRRSPPLRRRRVRHDAAQGDLLGAAAGLGDSRRPSRSTATTTTTRRWSCSWPSRAWSATAAVGRRPRPADGLPHRRRRATSARATACASPRRPSCSR